MEVVTLSQLAIKKALKLQEDTPEWRNQSLRLYLDGKGCDGFYYGVTFDEKKPEDLIFPQILAEEQPNGAVSIDLIIDPQTEPFVVGAQVEWIEDERGTGFLVENPHHKQFRGKFFRRKEWFNKLVKQQAENSETPTGEVPQA
jgi:iron-sulfur cluster insertion protein